MFRPLNLNPAKRHHTLSLEAHRDFESGTCLVVSVPIPAIADHPETDAKASCSIFVARVPL